MSDPITVSGITLSNGSVAEIRDTTKINSSLKGVANGVAELDGGGKVPSSQLPSYVDDVLEYNSVENFPLTGESGKIYVAIDTGSTYRWSGSTYVKIGDVGDITVTVTLDTVTNVSGSYTHNTTDNRVTSNMKPVNLELGDPSVFRDNIMVTCNNGSVTLSCANVVGTSTVKVIVVREN